MKRQQSTGTSATWAHESSYSIHRSSNLRCDPSHTMRLRTITKSPGTRPMDTRTRQLTTFTQCTVAQQEQDRAHELPAWTRPSHRRDASIVRWGRETNDGKRYPRGLKHASLRHAWPCEKHARFGRECARSGPRGNRLRDEPAVTLIMLRHTSSSCAARRDGPTHLGAALPPVACPDTDGSCLHLAAKRPRNASTVAPSPCQSVNSRS